MALRETDEVLTTFLIGCEETKQSRTLQLSIQCLLRLIENAAVNPEFVTPVVDAMWARLAARQVGQKKKKKKKQELTDLSISLFPNYFLSFCPLIFFFLFFSPCRRR